MPDKDLLSENVFYTLDFSITVSCITECEEIRVNAYTVETIQIQCLCYKREAGIIIVKKVKTYISQNMIYTKCSCGLQNTLWDDFKMFTKIQHNINECNPKYLILNGLLSCKAV